MPRRKVRLDDRGGAESKKGLLARHADKLNTSSRRRRWTGCRHRRARARSTRESLNPYAASRYSISSAALWRLNRRTPECVEALTPPLLDARWPTSKSRPSSPRNSSPANPLRLHRSADAGREGRDRLAHPRLASPDRACAPSAGACLSPRDKDHRRPSLTQAAEKNLLLGRPRHIAGRDRRRCRAPAAGGCAPVVNRSQTVSGASLLCRASPR